MEEILSIASLQADADLAAERAVLHGVEQPVPSYLYGDARSTWMARYYAALLWESAGRPQEVE